MINTHVKFLVWKTRSTSLSIFFTENYTGLANSSQFVPQSRPTMDFIRPTYPGYLEIYVFFRLMFASLFCNRKFSSFLYSLDPPILFLFGWMSFVFGLASLISGFSFSSSRFLNLSKPHRNERGLRLQISSKFVI